MATKYLYIDDNSTNNDSSNSEEKGFLSGLTTEQLTFDEYSSIASKFDNGKWKIREDLEKFIKDNTYQGILFDWNLTAASSEIANGETSIELASHIRQIISFDKEGNRYRIKERIKDIPLVLCSSKDDIAQRLSDEDKINFDLVEGRVEMIEKQSNEVLLELSKSYETLNEEQRTIYSTLNLSEADFQLLDVRFQNDFGSLFVGQKEKFKDKNDIEIEYETFALPHKIAQFLLREVIDYQGILVDEYVLAARLGVDIEESGDAWNKLKEILSPYKYTGIFGEAWERWWWFGVEKWWKQHFSGIGLRSSSASKRVEHITQVFSLQDLKASVKTEKSKSDLFWTACYYSKKPIDTIDGFTLAKDETVKAWQEKRYVSIDYVLESENVAIATIEKPRLTKLKELYGNR
jgi:hypothetical protein